MGVKWSVDTLQKKAHFFIEGKQYILIDINGPNNLRNILKSNYLDIRLYISVFTDLNKLLYSLPFDMYLNFNN